MIPQLSPKSRVANLTVATIDALPRYKTFTVDKLILEALFAVDVLS